MNRRRGMTLLEVVVAMVFIAVVMAVGGKLMLSNLRLSAATEATDTKTAQLDAMLGLLKRDAWSAGEVIVSDDTATLKTGDATVTWRVLDDGRVTRTGETTSTWDAFAPRLRFAAAKHGLIVQLGDAPGMLIESQVLRGGAR